MAQIAPDWNAGGWADNGPGTGGWTPPSPTPDTAASGRPATGFDSSTYQITQQTYPIDLMSNEYGGNYVIFYINVAQDSKLSKDYTYVPVSDVPPRDNSLLAATAQQNAGLSNKGVALALGVSAGSVTTVTAGTLGAGSGLATSLGAITGGAVGLAAIKASDVANFTGQKRRITTAIALHTPNTLSTTYGVNYSDEDLNVFGGAMAGAMALEKAKKAKSAGSIALDIAMAAGLSSPGAAGASKLTGLAANPRKEQIFKWVDFRTFSFEYQFFPRDAGESQNVLEIIKLFKYHMHPEFKDANNFLYIYPSEFDIMHYVGGVENLKLNRYTSSVLTDMVVDYSPQGQFTTFEGGMPTQINITLTFKELAVLTKEKIRDGL